jgi:hypothetical protein
MAAMAAGAATSMAQNVYSLNIVGYYNVPVTSGHTFTAMAVSLKAGTPANRADQVIPYVDGNNINVFTGTKFKEYDMDSGSSTGWTDPALGTDLPLTALPVLSPGKGFFYGNAVGVTNVTFVGEVPTGTNTVSVHSGLDLYGSPLPYAGKITTVDASNAIGLPVPDGAAVQKFNGLKFKETDRDSGSSTGWSDAATGSETTEPTLAVGEGFFLNNSSAPFVWTQILNP